MASALFTGVKHAQLYAKFRPLPPQSLTDYIISYLKKKIEPPFKRAVDIGCGSGQSTKILSPYFEHILGLDASESQIKNAKESNPSDNIEYRVSNCKELPVQVSSVQLVTFCQSLHWFKADEIFPEVQRILVPNGVVATYGYLIPLPKVDNEDKNNKIKDLINQYLYEEILGKYWDKGRRGIDAEYKNINLPFKNSTRMNFVNTTNTSLADYIGYLSTWSAYNTLLKEDHKKAEELLQDIQNKFIRILNDGRVPEDIVMTLYTDYFMIIGHK